jgi:TPR repeat protein
MKRFVAILLFCIFAFGMSDYNQGIDYYKKGNYKKAVEYFLKSANNGNSESQYILGYFYTGGIGVKQDLKQSLKWYEKAAKNNHTNAQINLGFMYIAGHGTKVDYKKAAYWIGKAKNKGSQKALMLWKEFELEKYN